MEKLVHESQILTGSIQQQEEKQGEQKNLRFPTPVPELEIAANVTKRYVYLFCFEQNPKFWLSMNFFLFKYGQVIYQTTPLILEVCKMTIFLGFVAVMH